MARPKGAADKKPRKRRGSTRTGGAAAPAERSNGEDRPSDNGVNSKVLKDTIAA